MAGLKESDFGPDPVQEFGRWLEDAKQRSGQRNPNAMTLCTVSPDGWPQGRIVLLKGFDQRGLCFFSNSRSEKGRALQAQPRGELVFHWDAIGRQVRVQGGVQPQSAEEADAYFMTRPRDSRLAAWASQQSEPASSREDLEARLAMEEERFKGREVTRPPHWWGYRLQPRRFEFWQEAQARFHERFAYALDGSAWRFSRLNP